jgi:hypothetical protein
MKTQDIIIAEEKIKGVDGKACWPGKRYAGKVKKADGTYKDKCVPVKGVAEAAPPGAKAERMVKHIKAGYAKDGRLTDVEKRKAFGAAWKAHNKGVTEGTDNVDSLVTDTEAVMKKFKMDATQELTTQALKIVLGEREYKDRPGYYYSFIRQIIARSKQQGLAEGYDPVESDYQQWEDILVKDGYRGDPSGAYALKLVVGHQLMLDPAEVASTIRNILTYVKQNRQVLGKAVSDRTTVKDAIIDIKNKFPQQYQAAQQPQGVAEVDMNRRGFLKGLGAAAVAGAAGGAMAQSQLPMAGLPDVENVDLHKMIITLDGQEYPLIKLSPTDIRPRGGRQVQIACAQMGERCLGHYNALLAGGRVFVLPGTKIDSTQPATNTAPARIDSPSGTHDFSKEFLQQASNPNRTGRYMISVEKAQELLKQMQEGMTEGFNGEYDDEAGMADNNLETLARAVDGIDDLIQSGDNLPEWCQEKIAVAKSMLVAVWDYMASEEASDEVDPEVDEMFEAMDQLAEQLAAKHRVSTDTVWESFEALDDHMLYETAAWRRKEGKSKSGGLNAKGVASYRRENPGSKLQTAVTTKPSKLKPGSKAAKRRKSFCARMSGVKGPMKKPNGKPTRKALALRKWNC